MKKKAKVLTDRQQEFIQEYEKNAGNINRTCQNLHMTPSRAKQLLQHPLVKERLSRSVQTAKEQLEAAAPHLVNLAMELVNDEEVSVKVRASLIDSLLDRAGVVAPKTPAVSISINTEISDRARQILAERQAAAALPIDVEVKDTKYSEN